MHDGERLRLALIEDRHAWLERLAAQAPGEVAHVGCADSPYTAELLASGTLLHERLVRVSQVTGIDVDGPALGLIGARFPQARLQTLDVSVDVPVAEARRYALVIAGEVLEHVPDAGRFLRGCAALAAPGGRVCVTVPNACCPKLGLRAVLGRESVHPDHHVYYGPRTLERALDEAGLELRFLATCFPPGAGRSGRLLVNPLLRGVHHLAHGPVGDGLIAVASARSNATTIAS